MSGRSGRARRGSCGCRAQGTDLDIFRRDPCLLSVSSSHGPATDCLRDLRSVPVVDELPFFRRACHHHASAADRRSLRDHGHHGLSGDSPPGRGHHGRDYDLCEMLKVHGVYERSRGAANYPSVRVQDL